MANAQHGEVEITVDGKVYTLRLGVNELCALQSDLGLADHDDEFMGLVASAKFLKSISLLRKTVFRALSGAHPDATIEDAGDMITSYGIIKMREALGGCMKWGLPERTTKATESGGEARPSPGPTS